MNRIERRIRNMINPYSTAFAMWWCHSGRYTRLARVIMGTRLGRPGKLTRPPRQVPHGMADEGSGGRVPYSVMASRRAAIDALLARHDDTGTGGC